MIVVIYRIYSYIKRVLYTKIAAGIIHKQVFVAFKNHAFSISGYTIHRYFFSGRIKIYTENQCRVIHEIDLSTGIHGHYLQSE